MGAPILVQKDSTAKAVCAAFVASKGEYEHAVKHVCMKLYWLGHKRVTVRGDQENSIEDRIREVKKNRVEMVHKELPVGGITSQSDDGKSGQDVQRQTRLMRSGLEGRLWVRSRRDHLISTWLVVHAANTINIFRVGPDGRAAYQRVT